MLKIKRVLIASILAVSLISCTSFQTKIIPPKVIVQPKKDSDYPLEKRVETKLKDVYGYENVYLKNLYDLTFEDTDETYKLPSDLEKAIGLDFREKNIELRDKAKFEREVFGIAEKLGYSKEKIKSLQPLEALELVGYIVAENYEFKFINYSDKTIDEIFEARRIKCTDYMYSVIAVFDIIKEINPRLNNVYVTTHLFCRYIGHAWNTIVVMGKEDVQVAYFDATWYDTGETEDFNATDKWHIDFERWKSQLYADLGDYDAAQQELKQLIEKTKDERRLEQLLERSAYYYFAAHENKTSLKVYEQLLEDFQDSKSKDEYIYYVGWNSYVLGDYERVEECIKILREQYPDSLYKLDRLEEHMKQIFKN